MFLRAWIPSTKSRRGGRRGSRGGGGDDDGDGDAGDGGVGCGGGSGRGGGGTTSHDEGWRC